MVQFLIADPHAERRSGATTPTWADLPTRSIERSNASTGTSRPRSVWVCAGAARHDAADSETRSDPVHAFARSVSGCQDLHRDLTRTNEHHPQRRIHMTTSTVGLLAGLLLGVAAAAGGFTGFLIALVLGVIGYLVGGQRDGEFDLGVMLKGRGRG